MEERLRKKVRERVEMKKAAERRRVEASQEIGVEDIHVGEAEKSGEEVHEERELGDVPPIKVRFDLDGKKTVMELTAIMKDANYLTALKKKPSNVRFQNYPGVSYTLSYYLPETFGPPKPWIDDCNCVKL